MKTYAKLFSVLAVAAMLVLAPSAFAGISGSVHDIRSVTDEVQICNACHTPHNADDPIIAPLWNHDATAGVFVPYDSVTMSADAGTITGVSKLCLSCHDGTIAVDAFGGAGGTTTLMGAIPLTTAVVGIDLTNDHPVGVDYAPGVTALDLNPDTDSSNVVGGSDIATDMLFSGKVECASCHDVHDELGNSYLLRVVNTGSALCLTCHDK